MLERKKVFYFRSRVDAEQDRDLFHEKYAKLISAPTSLRNIKEVSVLIADIRYCEETMAKMNRKIQHAENTLNYMEVDLENTEYSTSSSEDSN